MGLVLMEDAEPPKRTNKQLHDDGVRLAIELLRRWGIDVGERPTVTKVGSLVRVQREDGFVVGIRIRRAKYSERHLFDVTIRLWSRNSVNEVNAILNKSWCDVYFYGFVDESEEIFTEFLYYHVIDVHAWYRRPGLINAERVGNAEHRNKDGSRFISVDVRSQPREVVRGSSEEIKFRRLFGGV